MNKNTYILIFLLFTLSLKSQENTKTLTLQQVVDLALEQSPEALLAKHSFRSSYWEFRSYKAGMLPSLSLNSSVLDFNNSISSVIQPDGTEEFIERQINNSHMNLQIRQNVGLTGGNFFISSSIARIDDFKQDSFQTSYMTTPLSIGYYQPVFQYNRFKWEKKIEPLRYEEAKWEYIYKLEMISERAVRYFFDLALAQLNVEIAEANYYNNDTIYKIAQGRYEIGTIVENELLETELAFLNAKSDLAQSKLDLEVNQFRLRSFLGFNNLVKIRLKIEKDVPYLEIPLEKAIEKSQENNSSLLALERQLLEAAMDVAQTRAENRFNANLYATFGLNQSAFEINNAYAKPDNQQRVTVGLEIPIIDWGEGKGKYRMAQSNQEVVRTRVEQTRVDFEQQVYLKVMQFNQQDNQLIIAAKADTIAQKRYEVSKQRFLIGKIDVLDLNVASTDKDVAMRNYINTLKTYWTYFYNIRQYTLYDFINDVPLDVNFEELEY